jgi:glycosyltransferase involved in cell wall biosynthesis
LETGTLSSRVSQAPLTHLFVSYALESWLRQSQITVQYEPWALFMGRIEYYKGIDTLLMAARRIGVTVVIAGPGRSGAVINESIPPNIIVRNELISDRDAIDLFCRCGLLVLPYIEASQSALVAAAYFFRKPVVVTQVGALPEYVIDGDTGWVVPPNDPQVLADALQVAMADPGRLKTMGRAGRSWYEDHRLVETETLLKMYSSVARRGQP